MGGGASSESSLESADLATVPHERRAVRFLVTGCCISWLVSGTAVRCAGLGRLLFDSSSWSWLLMIVGEGNGDRDGEVKVEVVVVLSALILLASAASWEGVAGLPRLTTISFSI